MIQVEVVNESEYQCNIRLAGLQELGYTIVNVKPVVKNTELLYFIIYDQLNEQKK